MSQGSELFRREAIEASNGNRLGSIIIAAPPSRWILSGLASFFACVVLLILCLGHYTRRETVAGQLVPSAGLLSILAPSSGIVSKLHVQNGQAVKAGDLLFEMSVGQDSALLGNTASLVATQLDIRREALRSDLLNQKRLSDRQADALRSKMSLLRGQISEINGQLAIQERLIDGSQGLLDKIKPLGSKGYVSIIQIQEQESSLLNAQAQYKSMARQMFDAEQQLDAAQQQMAQLPLEDETKSSATQRQLAEVNQDIAQNEMQRALVIRAPRDGLVSSVLLKQGQAARVDQAVLAILPSGSTLQAQLLVPSKAVGFIEVGSQVVIRYQAFPYQKFGQSFGRVISVSRSALSQSEVASLSDQQSREPLYQVLVGLQTQKAPLVGETAMLKPGMALDADVLMERRRLFEWVFEPLYGMGHRLNQGAQRG